MRIRKLLVVVGLVAVLGVGLLAGRALEKMGNPDSTGDPTSTSSYTLEDIYKRLNAGTDGSQSTFTEPGAGPGTPTMHTLDEIMGVAPAADNIDGATSGDVTEGKAFWGLNVTAGEWGLRTGTSTTCATCEGDLSDGGRWCDNLDGTVTDMTTGLVWLKDADWGGQNKWEDCTSHDDAHTRAGLLYAGATGAGLSDGSEMGDWRLPTLEELKALTTDPERVLSGFPHAFTGVQACLYWSSATLVGNPVGAWLVDLYDGDVGCDDKYYYYYVWPVRGP